MHNRGCFGRLSSIFASTLPTDLFLFLAIISGGNLIFNCQCFRNVPNVPHQSGAIFTGIAEPGAFGDVILASNTRA